MNRILNRAAGVRRDRGKDLIPIYYRLQKDLKEKIENGQWVPGRAIPPARKIAETRGISLGTVQKAILNLANEGYLYSIQGKGTFVANTTIRRESLRYIRMRTHFLSDDVTYHIKVIDLKVVGGIQPIGQYLKTAMEDLFQLKRVFIANYGPIAYTISYLPCNLFEKFRERARIFLEKMTLYEGIEKEYGLPTISNQELFGVTKADRETAEILGIEMGLPVLSVEMLSYTYKEKPYEYRISFFPTDEKKLFREML